MGHRKNRQGSPGASRGFALPGSGLAADAGGWLGRHADVALAVGVVSIVAMMIVPLPTFLLDLLVAVNIAGAVVLLLISLYVADALKVATFPTLLLLTTLFRLAIEVSATRLILLRGDAGHVIRAFGDFVVSGNLVVGAVIFLILTLIQFLVVAKGSERVAEVGARFTLDAMPGKQMSIDAELRAGHIDHAEARRRRAVLTRESQFFGSMDGAMKFVKGDAVAGLVVLLINIVGGLIIGVFQRGMGVGAAARAYTILTIGEGLVAQIPALVISTAAGVLVTRVSSEDEGGHLGRDIGGQILAQPKALAIAAGLLGVLALVPGLPAVPFLMLAAGLGLVAHRLLRGRPRSLRQGRNGSAGGAASDGKAPGVFERADAGRSQTGTSGTAGDHLVGYGDLDGVPAGRGGFDDAGFDGAGFDPNGRPDPGSLGHPGAAGQIVGGRPGEVPAPLLTPMTLELGLALAAEVAPGGGGRLISHGIPGLRARCFGLTGLPLPAIRVRVTAQVPPRGFVIRLHEAVVVRGEIRANSALALAAAARVREIAGVDASPAQQPDGSQAAWIEAAARERTQAEGIPALDAQEIVLEHLLAVARAHGHEWLGIQETQALLEALERTHPALVREVVPKLISPVLLTDVLRRLAQESVSLRALREILGALAEWAPLERDPVALTELVRGNLRRQITHQHARPNGTISVYLLDPMIEDTVREAIQKTATGSYLALEPELARDIVHATTRTVTGEGHVVILTNADVRRYVRRLLEPALPRLAVLSFQELSPEVQIQPLGRVSVGAVSV